MLIPPSGRNVGPLRRNPPRRLARGFSIVELLVGVAIGLFILSGATAMFVSNVTNSRQLLKEARVNQELRAAMDLITRDLRRGAYWGNSLLGTSTVGSTGVSQENPYRSISVTGSNKIEYAYSRDAAENDSVDNGTEQFGIWLDGTVLKMLIGGSWQTLTNSGAVSITGLTITPAGTTVDIRSACAKTCTDTSASPTCPRLLVRKYIVNLQGASSSDSTVSRTLTTEVRVRNDEVIGTCPA